MTSTGRTEVTATELGELLQKASHAFARRGIAGFAAHDLSPARVRLIVTVGESPDIRMRELADRLGVTARAVTPLVDRLEREGLISRTPDATDRRAFRLSLTKRGENQREAIAALQESVSATAFAALTSKEQVQLADLLTKFLTPQ
ncbi:MarR family winged helix-turn-helix transcriptional regulator [Nocardia sp. CDC160]|uniref:MarR family winged helix-turn-helix transcriptional regulator n=1 Tax=Nocardia sp. CDC160 TaxID=3112166 RepID=UPI002DBDBAAD|nr:MarR family transcriptional regulator [Nocardia sp. CDC160]MEC3919793.1 MarR family transcriptional regulator [Nocardia sp. CDC160]